MHRVGYSVEKAFQRYMTRRNRMKNAQTGEKTMKLDARMAQSKIAKIVQISFRPDPDRPDQINFRIVRRIQNNKISVKSIKGTFGRRGHNKNRGEAFLDSLETTISFDPTKSMRRLSNELKVDKKNKRTAVHDNLEMKSDVRIPIPFLTTPFMQKMALTVHKIPKLAV